MAFAVLKAQRPQKIIVATPVVPPDPYHALNEEADQVIGLAPPTPFYALSFCYENFVQVTDDEVRKLLDQQSNHHTFMNSPLHPAI